MFKLAGLLVSLVLHCKEQLIPIYSNRKTSKHPHRLLKVVRQWIAEAQAASASHVAQQMQQFKLVVFVKVVGISPIWVVLDFRFRHTRRSHDCDAQHTCRVLLVYKISTKARIMFHMPSVTSVTAAVQAILNFRQQMDTVFVWESGMLKDLKD